MTKTETILAGTTVTMFPSTRGTVVGHTPACKLSRVEDATGSVHEVSPRAVMVG